MLQDFFSSPVPDFSPLRASGGDCKGQLVFNHSLNGFWSRREFLTVLGVSATSAITAGCGTIFHPERRGQPAGQLDWKIVAADAVGLIFFFVPGVVAFAVDFATGAIYLPAEDCVDRKSPQNGLAEIRVPRDTLSLHEIETTVSREIAADLQLRPGTYETRELEHLDEFWQRRELSLRSLPG